MLNKQELMNQISSDILSHLPEEFADAKISIEDVQKDGSIRSLFIVINKKNNVGTAMDTEDLYQLYTENNPVEKLVEAVARIIIENNNKTN
jgi:hypothetical protein